MNLETFLSLLKAHNYLAIAIVVIGYLVRLTAPDSKFWITIPDKYRDRAAPMLVLALSLVYAVLVGHVANGVPWPDAILHGVQTSLLTMGAYAVLIKVVFNGNEPAFMKALAFVFDNPSIPPPAIIPKDLQEKLLDDSKKDAPKPPPPNAA